MKRQVVISAAVVLAFAGVFGFFGASAFGSGSGGRNGTPSGASAVLAPCRLSQPGHLSNPGNGGGLSAPGHLSKPGNGRGGSSSCAEPFSIELSANPLDLICDGKSGSTLTVHLRDRDGKDVPNGTPVDFLVFAYPAQLDPASTTTSRGIAETVVHAGPFPVFEPKQFDVRVSSEPILATFRVRCSPSSPVVCPPGGLSDPGRITNGPCPTSTPPPPPPTPEPNIGGTISIGTPTMASGTFEVPVLTSASIDPYTGANVHLVFDTQLLDWTSTQLGSALNPAPLGGFCAPTIVQNGATTGCVALGSPPSTSAGTLMTFALTPKAAAGCVKLHLFRYGSPDGGDESTGTFTIGAGPGVQQNTYGPDVTVNLADGTTGCTP